MGNAAGVLGGQQQHTSAAAAAIERAILQTIHETRVRPQACLLRLQTKIVHYKGKDFVDPVSKTPVVTKEGRIPVQEMIEIMKRAVSSGEPPQIEAPVSSSGTGIVYPPFCPDPKKSLSLCAEDHAVDMAATGIVQHTGSNGSSPADRMSYYGVWYHCCGECIWYGSIEIETPPMAVAQRIVDALLVDDGVPDRGHRKCLLDARMVCGGVGCAPHPIFGFSVVIDVAGEVTEGLPADLEAAEAPAAALSAEAETAQRERQEQAVERHKRMMRRMVDGPPQPSQETIDRLRGSATTHWDLGVCAGCGERMQGGRVVSAGSEGRSWHDGCFKCCRCECSLRGVPHMEAKDSSSSSKLIVCRACFETVFAEKCTVCGKGMADRVLTLSPSGERMHPHCYSKGPATHHNHEAAAARTSQSQHRQQGAGGAAVTTARKKTVGIARQYADLE